MKEKRWSMLDFMDFKLAELRVVLLGNSWSHRCLVGNILMNDTLLDVGTELECCRTFKERTLTVINTPDLFHSDLTEDRLTELVTEVSEASSPGPHLFLLVLQPETFTEEHQQRLQSILEKFSEKPYDHVVIVLLMTDQQENDQKVLEATPHLQKLIRECGHRCQWIRRYEGEDEKQQDLTRTELLSQLTTIVNQNSGNYLNDKELQVSQSG